MSYLNHSDLRKAEAIIQEVEIERGKASAPAKTLRDFYDINKWIAESQIMLCIKKKKELQQEIIELIETSKADIRERITSGDDKAALKICG